MDELKDKLNTNGIVLKKAEKLTTALYLVTDSMPESEPIKGKLRERALDMLSLMYFSPEDGFRDRSERYFRTMVALDEIVTLIGIASAVKMLSGMNATVLLHEYAQLKGNILSLDEVKTKIGPTIAITEEFFRITEEIKPQSLFQEKITPQISILGDIHKGQNSIKDKNEKKQTPKITQQVKFISPQTVIKQKDNKGSRRDTILSLAKKKDFITVRDVTEVISGCSEKTIQRELSTLVDLNILKKEGEKRWSKYSLR